MKESRRTFLSVVGIYAAGSWVVLQVIDVLNQNVGLPPWAFSLALMFLLIGLPVIGTTAWLQGRAQNDGAAGAEDPSGSPTGPHELFTWRNAALAGLGAMALWGIFATAWMVRERGDEPAGPDAGSASAIPEGPTGFLTIRTRPAGATVESRRVESVEGQVMGAPIAHGLTPVEGIETQAGEHVIYLSMDDFSSITLLAEVVEGETRSIEADLLPASPLGAGMVVVPAGPAPGGAGGTPVEAFLLDRHEVTNREFADFMADDGYGTANLWPDSMTVDGSTSGREGAVSRLTDRTGAVGPRTWSGSVFPAGAADHPVNGVSWYEANAYCQWKGKKLPAGTQWWRAALGAGDRPYPWGDDSETLRHRANFEAVGTMEAESLPLGLSQFGAFEMAGNVREWLRAEDAGPGMAPSIGGSWQDPEYTFSVEWREALPLGLANEMTGFRCVRHIE
jgi:formylglycine-generating enzyme required for sulfatase activity